MSLIDEFKKVYSHNITDLLYKENPFLIFMEKYFINTSGIISHNKKREAVISRIFEGEL